MDTYLIPVLISAYIWGFFLITLIPLFLIYSTLWIVSRPFDRYGKITHYYTAGWAGLYLRINPWWRITIEDKEKIPLGIPFVFIANHQSLLDIALLYQLYQPFKWISKPEMFRTPVIGWVLSMDRHIMVRKGDKESILKMAEACRKSLKTGIPVFMFPEGTRSRDGILGPFREGAFILARDTGVPIVPVILLGASDALPKKGLIFKGRQHFSIRILDIILPETINRLSSGALADFTHCIMADEMKRMQKMTN
jgi:1-acyl-sn-glycerol-3-phosphate acyltransferase